MATLRNLAINTLRQHGHRNIATGLRHASYDPFNSPLDLLNIPDQPVYTIPETLKHPGHLPPCFGLSKSTVHRRFTIWTRAGLWDRLRRVILERLVAADALDVSHVIVDSVHVRTKRGAKYARQYALRPFPISKTACNR
ncbi:hypothetical protein [Kitasatospora sp. GAS1066B]